MHDTNRIMHVNVRFFHSFTVLVKLAKRQRTVPATAFQIFGPEKLPGYAIMQKLLADVVKIRHAFVRC